MRASSTRRDRPRRDTARLTRRLDAAAQATREILPPAVGRLPTPVFRQVMDGGLRHGIEWRVNHRRVSDPVHTIVVHLEPKVRPRVHAAARAAGSEASAWVCHMLQQVTLEDLPAHWQTGEGDPHAHDSCHDEKRDMMRLDRLTRQKLDEWSEHVGTSIAEIIRHLVNQATPEDFPETWPRASGGARRAYPRHHASTRRRHP